MKRRITIVLFILLIFTSSVYSQSGGDIETLQAQIDVLSTQQVEMQDQIDVMQTQIVSMSYVSLFGGLFNSTPEPTKIIEISDRNEPVIIDNDFVVEYMSFSIGTLWDGNYYIQIKVKFTNHYAYKESFSDKIWMYAYQNDQQLEKYTLSYPGEYIDVDKNDSTIVNIAFRLIDIDTDTKINIGKRSGFLIDSQVSSWLISAKEIKDAVPTPTPIPTATATPTIAPTHDQTSWILTIAAIPTSTPTPIIEPYKTLILGDYTIDIMNISRFRESKDRYLLKFDMEFYNNSNESNSFQSAFSYTVFFNGIELETTNQFWDDTNINLQTKIRPGAHVNVTRTFELPEIIDGDVEIDISPLFDHDKSHQYSGYLGTFSSK